MSVAIGDPAKFLREAFWECFEEVRAYRGPWFRVTGTAVDSFGRLYADQYGRPLDMTVRAQNEAEARHMVFQAYTRWPKLVPIGRCLGLLYEKSATCVRVPQWYEKEEVGA